MEKQLDDICDALEEMMDAADDAWEAEQRGSINRRDSIRSSRYDPAKDKFRNALDRYIDNRIKEYHNNKMDMYHDPLLSQEVEL
jgi:hypothetical protein